ncbi:MAG: nucleotide sugar dehydrogenase, partial [Deltaproteobacteria bacterium]|nr:nucleotide sugar dehydrogenase [Deltaproteobacteria bacterium]
MKKNTARSRKIAKELSAVSICPAGKIYPLPAQKDSAREFDRLRKIVGKERRKGREIVVVMGLGFVGAVMAGVIADSTDR